jgi:hypothetical protein
MTCYAPTCVGRHTTMGRKCYISFKTEDAEYKEAIQEHSSIDMVDKSLDEPIQSVNEDYILRRIREDYLADSTVTIHLIGLYSAENLGQHEQRFIKRELQASLYNSQSNPRNGILGVVLPDAKDLILRGEYACTACGRIHGHVALDDNTTVREFSYNYYIPNGRCCHAEEDRYCVLIDWNLFIMQPNEWIERAFIKRSDPIASKVKIYGL